MPPAWLEITGFETWNMQLLKKSIHLAYWQTGFDLILLKFDNWQELSWITDIPLEVSIITVFVDNKYISS